MAMKIDAGNEKVVRGEELRVDPRAIQVGTNYGRYEDTPSEEILQQMIDSIKEYGQLQPVRCRRTKPDNKLILVSGRTRYEAIQWINTEKDEADRMLIRVSVFDGNEADAAVEAAIENSHRNDSTPMDKAKSIKYLSQVGGKTTAEIAKLLRFKTPASIYQYQGLLSLDEKTRRLVHTGVITFSDALKLLKMEEDKRAEIVTQIEQETVETQPEADPMDALRAIGQAVIDSSINATQPTPATASAPSKPKADAPKKPRTTVSTLIRKSSDKPVKRSIGDVRSFFDIMIGGKASPITPQLQALAQEMINLVDGVYDDGKQVDRFELLIANINGSKAAK